MSAVSPAIQNLAQRLLVLGATGATPAAASVEVAGRVCAKLRGSLAKFAGEAGFAALLARALALAKAEVPALEPVQVRADGTLAGVDQVQLDPTAGTSAQGAIALVTQLLTLLVTFVGEPLTLRLVRDAWPDVSLDRVDLSVEVKP